MIERIVLFKLVEGVDRRALVDEIARVLREVEGLSGYTLGLPADAASEKSWDLSLVLQAVSAANLSRALESAELKALLHTALPPRCQVIKGWSFETVAAYAAAGSSCRGGGKDAFPFPDRKSDA